LEPTNARIYYEKSDTRKTNDTSLATALLNGKNILTIDYNNALPIITNLVFYSKLNYEIGQQYNMEIQGFMQKLVIKKAMNQINIALTC
jgi:hypothetical protein